MRSCRPQFTEADRLELATLCSLGTTLYTIHRHSSRSGQTARLDVYVVVDNLPKRITELVAGALEQRVHNNGGLVTNLHGVDPGKLVVRCLAEVLHDDLAALQHDAL